MHHRLKAGDAFGRMLKNFADGGHWQVGKQGVIGDIRNAAT